MVCFCLVMFLFATLDVGSLVGGLKLSPEKFDIGSFFFSLGVALWSGILLFQHFGGK